MLQDCPLTQFTAFIWEQFAAGCLLNHSWFESMWFYRGSAWCFSYTNLTASHCLQKCLALPWSNTGASLTLPYASTGSTASRKHLFFQLSSWPVLLPQVVYCRDRWAPGTAQENCWECQVRWLETIFLAADSLVISLSNHVLEEHMYLCAEI